MDGHNTQSRVEKSREKRDRVTTTSSSSAFYKKKLTDSEGIVKGNIEKTRYVDETKTSQSVSFLNLNKTEKKIINEYCNAQVALSEEIEKSEELKKKRKRSVITYPSAYRKDILEKVSSGKLCLDYLKEQTVDVLKDAEKIRLSSTGKAPKPNILQSPPKPTKSDIEEEKRLEQATKTAVETFKTQPRRTQEQAKRAYEKHYRTGEVLLNNFTIRAVSVFYRDEFLKEEIMA